MPELELLSKAHACSYQSIVYSTKIYVFVYFLVHKDLIPSLLSGHSEDWPLTAPPEVSLVMKTGTKQVKTAKRKTKIAMKCRDASWVRNSPSWCVIT